eukprot:m.80301 g.80301  ORF g.80301 m.80301 type:complete len:245 (-) comp12011_c0_seq1:332-1066(-)
MKIGAVDVSLSRVLRYTLVPVGIIGLTSLFLDASVFGKIASSPYSVATCAVAVACPILWNTIPYFLGTTLTNAFGRKTAMLAFAAFTVSMSAIRGVLFERAMEEALGSNVFSDVFGNDNVGTIISSYVGPLLIAYGLLVSLSSFYRLGIFGTYMGEYFGIMLSEKITSFPFNHVDNPMYFGSTVTHFGKALSSGSPVGIVLAAFIGWTYFMGAAYEEPLMHWFYDNRKGTVIVKNGWDVMKKFD